MSTRRPYQPPDPPAAPSVPRLQVQRATRGVRERVRWWLVGSGSLMALFLWAGLWLLVVPMNGALLCFVALPGTLALTTGVVYFNLPLVDEAVRFVFFVLSGKQELDLRWALLETQRKALVRYARRYYGARQPKERVIEVRVTGSSPVENVQEHPTQQLPALPSPPPPVAYYGTPLWAIVAALGNGQPCSERALPDGCTRDGFKAAVRLLAGAGVVIQRARTPLALAPAFAPYAASPVLLHQEVARVLGAREE